jgi:hypothetical protein
MANTVTKEQRQQIQTVANAQIVLGANKLATNYAEVVANLEAQFGISKSRAKSHAARAARIKRSP